MLKDKIKDIRFCFNDDDSVTIRIEPAPSKKEMDIEEDEAPRVIWEGDLTATAKTLEDAMDKIRDMISLNFKSKNPRDVLSEYLSV